MEPLAARNPRVQTARRLARQPRERADRRAFVVEGPLLVAEAVAAGAEIQSLFFVAEAPQGVVESCRELGADLLPVTPDALRSIATTVTPQPLVAVVGFVSRSLETVVRAGVPAGHLLVLDAVQDPGNAGTILRSAEASGAGMVVFAAGSVDCHNPKVVRASAGSLFRVPLVDGGQRTEAVIGALRGEGRPCYGAAAGGELDYDSVALDSAMIVMGNESAGLDAATSAAIDATIRIPHAGPAESLNVAMAATVLCFEAARQRRRSPGPATVADNLLGNPLAPTDAVVHPLETPCPHDCDD